MLDTGLAVHLLRRRLGRVLQRSQRRVGSQAEAGDSPAGDREVSLGSEPHLVRMAGNDTELFICGLL